MFFVSVTHTSLFHSAGTQEHLRTHFSHGSWCPHCVSGRGVSNQHRPRNLGGDQLKVATVAAVHCFLRKRDDSIPVLGHERRETRMLNKLFEIWRGWDGRLVIRCDHAAALGSLAIEVARIRGDALTIPEYSAGEEGHGFMERCEDTAEEMVRAFGNSTCRPACHRICTSHSR